jgi:miniconductance mechanosensitive channel
MQWTIEKTIKQKEHKGGWLHLMAEQKLISNIFFAFSVVVLSIVSGFVLEDTYPKVTSLVVRVLDSSVIVAIMLVINSFLSFLSRKYATGLKLPVKGLIQAVKVVLWIITSILVMSVLINKQPMYLFGGLTALSAVLLLVFKDSILGLTSGFQLLVNDLVRVGDWIEVPGQRADGEIVDILITTVRVRNWDNTIVNVPAYNLIANSFVNWRGMSEAGARRIKRAMNIDLTTIRFLEKQDIEKLKEIHLIKDYLENKEKELAAYNADKGESVFNSRRLTNLGTFRAYCFEYLKSNPKIAKNFTCMVRQLEPTTEGVPLEVYAFSADTAWVNYENIQSDIFDHLFAVAKVFDLKIYQRYAVK